MIGKIYQEVLMRLILIQWKNAKQLFNIYKVQIPSSDLTYQLGRHTEEWFFIDANWNSTNESLSYLTDTQ